MRNGKVSGNPARLVQQQKEIIGRLRYLTREEYNRVCDAIRKLFPEHLAEFVVSVNTGMRLTEQYTCTWSQVDMDRRRNRPHRDKERDSADDSPNADALAAIKSVQRPRQKPTDSVFPRQGSEGRYDTRPWFVPCLAAAKITGYVCTSQPAHVLLMAGNGRGNHQRDSGTGRTQDNHHAPRGMPIFRQITNCQ